MDAQLSASRSERITLGLIEDNCVLRDGLVALLNLQPGLRVIWSGASIAESRRLLADHRPDVVLVDSQIAGGDGRHVGADLEELLALSRVIVTGLLRTQQDVATYVRAGVCGFTLKDAPLEELISAIRTVAAGGEVLPPALITSLFSQVASTANGDAPARPRVRRDVTEREQEIITLLVDGMSNQQIATKLEITVHTVKSHVHNILEKLGLSSRLELVAHMLKDGRPPLRRV